MASILLEKKWRNSRGGTEGWSFVQEGETVRWTYERLFDAKTQERSWGEASFDLASFRRLLIEFQRNSQATLTVPTGGTVTLKRLLDGTIDLSVLAAYGDGFACTLEVPRLGVLVPLGVDLAVIG